MIYAYLISNLIAGMLLWESVFVLLIFLALWSFSLSTNNLVSLLLTSEFLIASLFCLLLASSIYFNLNILFGLAYLVLILGGLELALSILILLI